MISPDREVVGYTNSTQRMGKNCTERSRSAVSNYWAVIYAIDPA